MNEQQLANLLREAVSVHCMIVNNFGPALKMYEHNHFNLANNYLTEVVESTSCQTLRDLAICFRYNGKLSQGYQDELAWLAARVNELNNQVNLFFPSVDKIKAEQFKAAEIFKEYLESLSADLAKHFSPEHFVGSGRGSCQAKNL